MYTVIPGISYYNLGQTVYPVATMFLPMISPQRRGYLPAMLLMICLLTLNTSHADKDDPYL